MKHVRPFQGMTDRLKRKFKETKNMIMNQAARKIF